MKATGALIWQREAAEIAPASTCPIFLAQEVNL
jgi:hypothetical protein